MLFYLQKPPCGIDAERVRNGCGELRSRSRLAFRIAKNRKSAWLTLRLADCAWMLLAEIKTFSCEMVVCCEIAGSVGLLSAFCSLWGDFAAVWHGRAYVRRVVPRVARMLWAAALHARPLKIRQFYHRFRFRCRSSRRSLPEPSTSFARPLRKNPPRPPHRIKSKQHFERS